MIQKSKNNFREDRWEAFGCDAAGANLNELSRSWVGLFIPHNLGQKMNRGTGEPEVQNRSLPNGLKNFQKVESEKER